MNQWAPFLSLLFIALSDLGRQLKLDCVPTAMTPTAFTSNDSTFASTHAECNHRLVFHMLIAFNIDECPILNICAYAFCL